MKTSQLPLVEVQDGMNVTFECILRFLDGPDVEGKCDLYCSLQNLDIEGQANLSSAVQIAQLALKHRQNKNQRQRIVIFIGSPIAEDKVTSPLMVHPAPCPAVIIHSTFPYEAVPQDILMQGHCLLSPGQSRHSHSEYRCRRNWLRWPRS